MLTADKLTVRLGGQTVLSEVSFALEEGQWLMLVGPNGAGKSTLISALSQGTAYTGRVMLAGRDARSLRPAQLALGVGVLAQRHQAGYGFTVEEIVRLGRYAYRGGFFSGRDDDGPARVEDALAQTGMTALRGSSVLTLSGGELQRAFLAQVLAQNPSVLLLDEPANHLDLVYQKRLFSLIQEWLLQPGRAVLSVVHDLSLARRYGTHALLLHHGQCVAQGTMENVLTPENLERVYSMDVHGWMREMLAQWQ